VMGRTLGWLSLLLAAGWAVSASADEKSDVKARLAIVEQRLNDWDVAGARRELSEVEKIVSDVEPVVYFRGRLSFEEGRYAEAVQLLKQAGMEDKPGSYLRLAQETQRILKNHKVAESEHFLFLYPPGKDEVLVPYALETLEAIRTALGKDLGHLPSEKVRVEVVNSARELSQVSTLTYEQIRTTGTIAICKFNKLMVTSPKAVLRGYEWQDTLAHEYVHYVVSQKSKNSVPIWLHEGMAKYLESRWRAGPGLAMSPSTLALLGQRVKLDKLIPFEKMHPSIAMLPTAEDAATAFAEVFFAMDYVYQERGAQGLQTIIGSMASGTTDKKAVEAATGLSFSGFEKAWLVHVRKQPFPRELLPRQKVVLKEQAQKDAKQKEEKKGREINFGDFAEVVDADARKMAHLGELMRERRRLTAAAEEYGKAHARVGDAYESLSNKYALALLELHRLDEAEKVLLGSRKMYPRSSATEVHLGRIYLVRQDWKSAKGAYLGALASDPFDEEIHFALLRIHDALGDKEGAARARKAAALLSGLKPADVDEVAKNFGKEKDLSDVDLPTDDAEESSPRGPELMKSSSKVPTMRPVSKTPVPESPEAGTHKTGTPGKPGSTGGTPKDARPDSREKVP